MAPERVLREMADLGLAATEFGPDGFLPADPQQAADLLASHGMRAVGGFVPAVLFDRSHDPLPEVERALAHFRAANATSLVLAAASGAEGYDARPVLDETQWEVLLANLDRIRDVAGEQGIEATLHPHVGTMVENAEEVDRVLDREHDRSHPRHRPPAGGRRRPRRDHPGGDRPDPPHPPQGRSRARGRAGPRR